MDTGLIIPGFRPLTQEDAGREQHSLMNCEQRLRPKRSCKRPAKKSPEGC